MSSKRGIVNEIHKPVRKNFPRRSVIIKGYDDLWQADLAEFIPHAKINKGYKYLLLVIDCYSKYLWTRALKSKTASEVSDAFESILKLDRKPKNLQTDDGTEFFNKSFATVMKKHDINHYSTYSVKKASIVERVIRTIKNWLYKEFSFRGNYKWIDIIKDIVLKYNNRRHRTTSMRPNNVDASTKVILKKYSVRRILQKSKFKVGDFVRISKYKSIFEKGYTGNWTAEIFQVYRISRGNPQTYFIKDFEGIPIKGQFYGEELLKSDYPDTYLVEKVLRKRGNNLYVKWLGYKNPTWIPKSAIE